MTSPEQRIRDLGLQLPEVPTPLAAYVPAVRSGNLIFTSGQLPTVAGELPATGKVGGDVSPEVAVDCARVAALNALAAVAALAADVGGLSAVARVVKMVVFVASTPGFVGHPQVGNGASEFLASVFGESGRHARSAVGVASLPLDSPVEVELVVELRTVPTVHPSADHPAADTVSV